MVTEAQQISNVVNSLNSTLMQNYNLLLGGPTFRADLAATMAQRLPSGYSIVVTETYQVDM